MIFLTIAFYEVNVAFLYHCSFLSVLNVAMCTFKATSSTPINLTCITMGGTHTGAGRGLCAVISMDNVTTVIQNGGVCSVSSKAY